MLKNMNLNYGLLFLSIFQCLNLNAMKKEENKTEGTLAKAKEAVANAQETIKRIPLLLENRRFQTNQRNKSQISNTAKQFKDQNTVLYRAGDFFAVYKSDVVRGACFGLDLFAEILTYKKIFEQKVDYVLESIKEDSINLENLLTQADVAQKANYKNNRLIGFIKNRFRTLPELAALQTYINNRHKMISYNPFKESLLPYLGLNLLKSKVLHFIEDSFISRPDMKHFFNEEVLEASRCAYEKGNDGNLRRLDQTPLSVITILMFLLNSRYGIERINFLSPANLRSINKFMGLNIPNFIFSDFMKIIASVGSLGLAVKFTDTLLNSSWSTYALKNQVKFLPLLKRYNILDKGNMGAVEKIERELRKFISDGHTQGIWSNLWTNKKESSQMFVKCLFLSPVIGALAWKAYQHYKAN